MIEFKLIKDRTEYIEPSAEEMREYNRHLDRISLDSVDWLSYHPQFPASTLVFHSVVDEMAGMVNEGWQIHTFSVDSNGVHFALMEREV